MGLRPSCPSRGKSTRGHALYGDPVTARTADDSVKTSSSTSQQHVPPSPSAHQPKLALRRLPHLWYREYKECDARLKHLPDPRADDTFVQELIMLRMYYRIRRDHFKRLKKKLDNARPDVGTAALLKLFEPCVARTQVIELFQISGATFSEIKEDFERVYLNDEPYHPEAVVRDLDHSERQSFY